MAHQVSELIEKFSGLIEDTCLVDGAEFISIDSTESCHSGSLVFVDDEAQLPKISPSVLVTRKEIAEKLSNEPFCVITVQNVRLAHAFFKQAYQEYDSRDSEWSEIHPSAVIHETAKLATGVRVGPNVVIGANSEIGSGSQIRANAVIEHDVKIGKNCIVNAMANIGYGSILGNRVNIHSGVVIGNEGFGFAQDKNRDYHRIPHTGWVELHDDVQVGANSNIDRGTYGPTILARGVKLDSLCHVAHNVHIDEGTLFASGGCIAGSTYVGKRVMASGQVGVLDHLKVADNVVLVHRSGVTENIDSPGMYAGLPAKPFKEYVRSLGASKRIDKLTSQLKEFKKTVLAKL
ncbi:MAG: UDP-3-O-(3-hydroxymyristoyl)glucosamine N-acyltransferase [Gammaproteobacteria bacterium]|nr:UDP-3-O-(3-hydroxymyristoyl)glucosamine N-acyltransferase [Gammaproteobacteria bacterium]